MEELSNSSFNKISIASLTEDKRTLSGKKEIAILLISLKKVKEEE